MEAMQLNAKECHTKEASMTVDIELVEVDRVSRAFLIGVAVGAEVPDAMVVPVVMVVNSESVFDGRNGNGTR